MKLRILFFIIIAALLVNKCNDEEKTINNKQVNLDNEQITAIAIDKNNIRWVGTLKGLYKSFDNGYELINEIDAQIYSIAYDSVNHLFWLGTSKGLKKMTIAQNQIQILSIADNNLSGATVNHTFIDNDRYWFGTNTGFSLNKGENWKKENFLVDVFGDMTNLEFEDTKTNSITAWDGDYYFATSGRSIYRAYGYDSNVDAFSGATQLASPYNGEALSDTMLVVFTDSKGNIWMGGNKGLQKHVGHDTKENNMVFTEFDNKIITSIAEDKAHNIWVGTTNGLAMYNSNSWVFMYDNTFITALAISPNGEIWIGTKNGLIVEKP